MTTLIWIWFLIGYLLGWVTGFLSRSLIFAVEKENKRRLCPPGKDCTERKERRGKDA